MLNIKFKDFLIESKEISISKLLERPKIFIMIIGGVASGKSHVQELYFSGLKLIDIDEYTKRESGGDFELARKLVSKAIKNVEADLRKTFKSGQSVVNTGTGASVNGVINKFKWAKDAGFETAIVFVDVPLKTALKRNNTRAASGERNLIPDYKVERTNKQARENFKIFKNIANFYMTIKT